MAAAGKRGRQKDGRGGDEWAAAVGGQTAGRCSPTVPSSVSSMGMLRAACTVTTSVPRPSWACRAWSRRLGQWSVHEAEEEPEQTQRPGQKRRPEQERKRKLEQEAEAELGTNMGVSTSARCLHAELLRGGGARVGLCVDIRGRAVIRH